MTAAAATIGLSADLLRRLIAQHRLPAYHFRPGTATPVKSADSEPPIQPGRPGMAPGRHHPTPDEVAASRAARGKRPDAEAASA